MISLGALSAVLARRRQAATPPAPAAQSADPASIVNPIVLELRDLKAVLQKHHDSTPRITPG